MLKCDIASIDVQAAMDSRRDIVDGGWFTFKPVSRELTPRERSVSKMFLSLLARQVFANIVLERWFCPINQVGWVVVTAVPRPSNRLL